MTAAEATLADVARLELLARSGDGAALDELLRIASQAPPVVCRRALWVLESIERRKL